MIQPKKHIYLVTNEDKRTVISAHYKQEDAELEADWYKVLENFTIFYVVKLEIQ